MEISLLRLQTALDVSGTCLSEVARALSGSDLGAAGRAAAHCLPRRGPGEVALLCDCRGSCAGDQSMHSSISGRPIASSPHLARVAVSNGCQYLCSLATAASAAGPMGGLEPEPGEEAVQMIGGIAAVFAVGRTIVEVVEDGSSMERRALNESRKWKNGMGLKSAAASRSQQPGRIIRRQASCMRLALGSPYAITETSATGKRGCTHRRLQKFRLSSSLSAPCCLTPRTSLTCSDRCISFAVSIHRHPSTSHPILASICAGPYKTPLSFSAATNGFSAGSVCWTLCFFSSLPHQPGDHAPHPSPKSIGSASLPPNYPLTKQQQLHI